MKKINNVFDPFKDKIRKCECGNTKMTVYHVICEIEIDTENPDNYEVEHWTQFIVKCPKCSNTYKLIL